MQVCSSNRLMQHKPAKHKVYFYSTTSFCSLSALYNEKQWTLCLWWQHLTVNYFPPLNIDYAIIHHYFLTLKPQSGENHCETRIIEESPIAMIKFPAKIISKFCDFDF